MALIIKITDPQTATLLQQYGQYVEVVDGVTGTLSQVAEGLMLGSLDEHSRFQQWQWSTAREFAA